MCYCHKAIVSFYYLKNQSPFYPLLLCSSRSIQVVNIWNTITVLNILLLNVNICLLYDIKYTWVDNIQTLFWRYTGILSDIFTGFCQWQTKFSSFVCAMSWVKVLAVRVHFSVFRLLGELPKPNVNLLHSLFGILDKIAQHSSSNYMTTSDLSFCIAPSLLWLPNSSSSKQRMERKRKVMKCLNFMPQESIYTVIWNSV